MIEIISTEQKKITDQEVTEALQTLRQYCKEHEDTGPECQGCCAHVVCGNLAPIDWNLPGDEEGRSMNDGMTLVQNEDGTFSAYDDTYDIVIHCETEEEKKKAIESLESTNWIPIDEKLPDPDKYILVSFENYVLSDIGRYEADEDGGGAFYPGDEDRSYTSFGLFVNAWMPLPEPYKEDEP